MNLQTLFQHANATCKRGLWKLMKKMISHIFQAASLSDKCGILLADEAEMLFQLALGTRPHPAQPDHWGEHHNCHRMGSWVHLFPQDSNQTTCKLASRTSNMCCGKQAYNLLWNTKWNKINGWAHFVLIVFKCLHCFTVLKQHSRQAHA